MITRGIERLRRAVRWPGSPSEGKALILLYHRVARLSSDPWRLAVTPHRFAEHLEVLREHARPMRLRQLSQALLSGSLPDRSVVITFDDGYADNLHRAKPLLKRYDIPATVFLTTGFIGDEREFWWDELDRLLLQPGTLPERLRLSVNGDSYQWELGEAVHYSEDDFQRYRSCSAYADAPSPRHRLYHSLWELLNPLTEGERRGVLDELLIWVGAEPAGRPTHRSLSLEEVVALERGKLIEVGAHTVTHPALSALPGASQREEIQRSKNRLEEILGGPVTSFAYPHGRPQIDYTAETVGIVREAGFACACSAFDDVVETSTDRFQLPRNWVRNWDREEFAKRLSRWFHD